MSSQPALSPLTALQNALAEGTVTPQDIAEGVIAHANGSASHNTYTHFNAAALREQAATLDPDEPLYGVPISLKDLFDLAGTPTSAGTRFFRAIASTDSTIAAALKSSGALITGKTHLHPLAYGVTGQNPEFGDCLQPHDATLLTGGSSSGAAASVQEGSALAAICTDTGGSVRIPAALCGLAGFRASHALPSVFPDLWRGGVHLAQSFDTIGLLVRDPRDLAPLAQALFRIPAAAAHVGPRVGCVGAEFLIDANPEVLAAYAAWKQHLERCGASLVDVTPSAWTSAPEIYSGIVAYEAAAIHREHLAALAPTLDPVITQRLRFGLTITGAEIDALRARHAQFRTGLLALFDEFDFLLMPSAPIHRLVAGQDQTASRLAILRYTSPFSLAGVPVATLPGQFVGGSFGTGVQIAAKPLEDGALLALAGRAGLGAGAQGESKSVSRWLKPEFAVRDAGLKSGPVPAKKQLPRAGRLEANPEP